VYSIVITNKRVKCFSTLDGVTQKLLVSRAIYQSVSDAAAAAAAAAAAFSSTIRSRDQIVMDGVKRRRSCLDCRER
jgi:hypothetical protein